MIKIMMGLWRRNLPMKIVCAAFGFSLRKKKMRPQCIPISPKIEQANPVWFP